MERNRSFGTGVAACILLCLPALAMPQATAPSSVCRTGPNCRTLVTGDLNQDHKVDCLDLQILPMYWLHWSPCVEQPAAGPDPNLYNEKLKWIILEELKPIVPFRFYTSSSGWNPPWPSFRPVSGLDTPDAVPFLIDVLLHGPDWTDETLLTLCGGMCPHVARCYAALCLGAIGDRRALNPLLEILAHGNYMEDKYTITYHRKDEHDIRAYAAFALGLLGDARAVDPLVESLRKEKWPDCVYSLARLRAFRAVPTMIEVLTQYPEVRTNLHPTLQYMLKTDFVIAEGETGWVVDAFPELGAMTAEEVDRRLWAHWLQAGGEYAQNQFETYYAQRKAAIEESPLATELHRHLQTHMLKGGVACLPYLMEKMAQGDNTLVPALATLTGDYSTTILCSPAECLAWWKEHQREWRIFEGPLMPGCLRVPADYPTIQAAIDDANDGDIVLVAPGTYTGDGNRDIDFRGKAITVKSEAGPRTCIIDCQGSWEDSHRGFYFHNREDGDSVLDGFTITGGVIGEFAGGGGGILCSGSSPGIRNCMVVGNVAGGGAGIALSDSDAVISNCVIAGNQARLWSGNGGCVGGGLSCAQGHPMVRNCTICGNHAYGAGGGVHATDQRTALLLVDCILVSNTGSLGTQLFSGGCTMIIGCPETQIINCCIENEPNAIFVENWSDPRRLPESCIQVDPLFAQAGYWHLNDTRGDPLAFVWVEGDYHLKSQGGRWDPVNETWVKDEVTSLCIDAGDPHDPVSQEPFPNGGRINMGAYGGTAEASKSYFAGPVCQVSLVGDLNGDCRVDLKDFALLARNWMRGSPDSSTGATTAERPAR